MEPALYTYNMVTSSSEKRGHMMLEKLSSQRYFIIQPLGGFSVVLLLLKAVCQVFAENAAAKSRTIIFNHNLFQILENYSLETYGKIRLLGTPKATTVISDAGRHGCRESFCCYASVHCYFCGNQYAMWACQTALLQEVVFCMILWHQYFIVDKRDQCQRRVFLS